MQERRQAGGVPPQAISNLFQLVSGFLGGQQQRPQPPQGPAYPDATPVPQSGAGEMPPTQTLLADGPNQVAQPAPLPPATPQEPPPPVTPQEQQKPPEVAREPDRPQPDPTTQPIIEPASGGPMQSTAREMEPQKTAASPIPPSLIDPRTLQEQRGLPQRTDFQAFVPFSPKGWQKWGQPRWQERVVDTDPEITRTVHAPAPHEAYRGIQNAGLALGQFGTGPGAPFAMAAGSIAKFLGPFIDMLSGGGRTPFTSAFNAAETQSLAKQKFMWQQYKDYYEMQRDHMEDNADEAVRRERDDLNRARDIIETAKNHGFHPTDEKKNWDIAEQKLREWAVNRPKLLGVLDGSGIKGLETQLDWEDAQIDNLAINNRSLRASDRRRAEARSAKGGGPTDLDREWSSEGTKGGDQRDAKGRLIPPGKDRAEGPDEAEPKEDETASMSESDREIAQRRKLSRSAMNAAHQVFHKGVPEGQTRTSMKAGAPNTYGKVLSAASDIENKVRDVLNGKGTPEEKLAEINKVDPQIGEILSGLTSYELNPDKVRDNHDRNLAMARQLDRNYDPSFFKYAAPYRNQDSKTGQVALRTATLPTSALALLQALRVAEEDMPGFLRNFEALKAELYDGDPKYAALHLAIRNYLTDVGAIQTGGIPRVTMIERGAQKMLSTASPAAIRASMMTDLGPAFSIIHDLNRNWQNQTKSNTNMPLYHEDSARMIDAISRMNPYDGRVPEDSPDALLSVGKQAPTGKNKPSWYKPPYDFKPMTRKEVNEWRDWLDKPENRNHPLAQQIREQIGIVPDLRPRYGR